MSKTPCQIITGDCRSVLPTLEAGSVHCCVTSPPYWGLRDYGVEGQIGLEVSFDRWLGEMVEVFRLVRTALRDDGTLWVNIGDAYGSKPPGCKGVSGSSKLHGVMSARYRETLERGHGQKRNTVGGVVKPKDLIGMPWRLAFALQADGWYLRSEIIWHKPNPMPESVRDRPTKSHEQIFLLSKSPKYHYDAEAIAEEATGSQTPRRFDGNKYGDSTDEMHRTKSGNDYIADGTRNSRTVWTIPTEGFAGAHYATFPRELAGRCIKAGCPGGGLVLDPFGGTGTTAEVALKLGRRAVCVELNPEYAAMARKRLADRVPLFSGEVA